MSMFSDALQGKIQHYLGRYETKRSAILPILHEIQDECGWIQPKHIDALEEEFGLLKVHVREVATFYAMYRLEECKPVRVYLCDNLVCCMLGAQKVKEKIQSFIKSPDFKEREGKFSVETVPCLGVCDGAPAMLVNKDRYLNVTVDNVGEILKTYEKEGKSNVGKH